MANNPSRFAVYLIPPYQVAQPVMEIHQLLRKQFGFIAADRFQVHATLKGFFKKTAGPLEPLLARLNAVFAEQRPFEVCFEGFRLDEGGIGLNISRRNGAINAEIMLLREQVVDAVRPFIAPDCDFAKKDLGEPFAAHITLAFRDIPAALYSETLACLKNAPIPTAPFTADTFHFLEFFSEEWAGDWEKTLTWKLHKTWYVGKHN